MELAAHLKRKGHTIEFRPQLPNGKESDFVARCEGQDVYFELKRMQASQKQLAADNLVYSVAMAMRRLTESSQSPQIKHRGYRIELADFSDGLGRGRESDESLISGIVQSIVRETRRRAEVGLPLDFVIPNVATVRIGDTGKESSGVTGFSASADHEMKRILRGHFLDALQQIHSKHPGIVVVQTPALLHRHNVEATLLDLLNGAELDAANLSSAIFLPVYHSIPEPWSIFHSFPVVNPKAKFPAMALKAFHDLREIYEAECRTVRDPK
ncbi:MAG: hypothetical protein HY647_03845 [Acidobacteria bacterium]|nr:hypothetical protein [Acidobacteriota bacterium]